MFFFLCLFAENTLYSFTTHFIRPQEFNVSPKKDGCFSQVPDIVFIQQLGVCWKLRVIIREEKRKVRR
jgi:hypothetical protein